MENQEFELNESGTVNVSDEVVTIIASLAASSVPGVAGMVNSFSDGIAEFLGKKNLSKGVKVNVSEEKATLDLYIIVEYGVKIPEVAWRIQEKVKGEVEAMTGLTVEAVNVNVAGVSVAKTEESEKKPAGAEPEKETAAEETSSVEEPEAAKQAEPAAEAEAPSSDGE